jgi:FtsP/CotA-like multicopper oxidase with cupredoxin domain
LHIPGYGNGDDMYRSVEGDNVMIYRINLPADKHHGGTHWYHSHLHGASWDQVKGGAFGMIVIDDNGHDVGTQDQHVLSFLENEKILVIDNTHNDESFTANGLPQEVFHFVQNEWYRLRILAVNVESHYSQETIEFSDSCQVYPIAHDGIFRFQVPASEPRNTFILTVSSRLDVAIQCSQDAEIKVDRISLATIKVDMSRQPSDATPFEAGADPWQSSRLEYTKDLRALQPDNSWKIRVDETNINHVSQAQRKPLCDDDGNDFEYGTVQSWELRGVATHPFHVHTYPMQIASDDCGDGHEPGEFYDTIVTEGSGSIAHPCIVRLHLVDVAGPTVVHCHIFEHAEHGALAYFNVLSGPDEDDAMEPTCVKGNTCVDSDPLPKCSGLERQLRKRWL